MARRHTWPRPFTLIRAQGGTPYLRRGNDRSPPGCRDVALPRKGMRESATSIRLEISTADDSEAPAHFSP